VNRQSVNRRLWRQLGSLPLLAAVTACAGEQTPKKENEPEQTVFGADPPPGEFIRKPVQVPPAALQVLRDSLGRGTINCLKHNGVSADDVPALWFVASEIHLDGPEEIELIVQPNLPKIGTDELPHHQAFGCVLGANVGPFWVLGNINGRYGLLLATYALGLEVLDSRSNFYRDIQATAATAGTLTTVLYKMSVAQYQVAEKKSEPVK
jgi:hypothetical protein